MAIIQDIANFIPSWQKHIDESGYLKADPSGDYHQKAGYNFKENFPNTPGYLADALGKAYQYSTEGIGSLFNGSNGSGEILDYLDPTTGAPAWANRAKEESRLNSLGFRGRGFDMDEYNQTMDFARTGDTSGLTYGSAQAAEIDNPELPPQIKQLINQPQNTFQGVQGVDIDDSWNESYDLPSSRFQNFKSSIGSGIDSIRNNRLTRGIGAGYNFLKANVPGMLMSGLGAIINRDPNAPSYQTRSPNINYSNLNTTILNDFYDSNRNSNTFGTNRFDRAKTAFGKSRTLFGPNGIAANRAAMAQEAAAAAAVNTAINTSKEQDEGGGGGGNNNYGGATQSGGFDRGGFEQDGTGRQGYGRGGLASLWPR